MVAGIYKIINKQNGKYYIGSSQHIGKRIREHKTCLRGNYHTNRHLQFSWNKYGEQFFDFLVVEIVDNADDLLSTEQKHLKNFNNLYNIARYAESSQRGRKASKETREKQSKAHLGRHRTKDTKEKIRSSMLGNRITGDRKKKITDWWTEDRKKKRSKEMKGEFSPMSKITWEDVHKIREMYKTGKYFQRELADIFNVSRSNISSIVQNRIWKE